MIMRVLLACLLVAAVFSQNCQYTTESACLTAGCTWSASGTNSTTNVTTTNTTNGTNSTNSTSTSCSVSSTTPNCLSTQVYYALWR